MTYLEYLLHKLLLFILNQIVNKVQNLDKPNR